MRNRHFPRVCQACTAPMEAQEDTCWRCGASWTSEPQAAKPQAALRVIDGGAGSGAALQSTAERLARLVAEARA